MMSELRKRAEDVLVVEPQVREVIPVHDAPEQLPRLASGLAGVAVGLAAAAVIAVITVFAAIDAVVDALDLAIAAGEVHESPHHMHSRFCVVWNETIRSIPDGTQSTPRAGSSTGSGAAAVVFGCHQSAN